MANTYLLSRKANAEVNDISYLKSIKYTNAFYRILFSSVIFKIIFDLQNLDTHLP